MLPNFDVPSRDCWHCSLLSYSTPHLSPKTMNQFEGYILPGIVFLILGGRWACQCVWEWSKKSLAKDYERAALPVPSPNYQLCPASAYTLPWEGIIKLVLTGLGIIISVVMGGTPDQNRIDDYVGNIRYATIYLFFALSGLMDILVYYCGYSVLPEGIQSFILSLAFTVEGIVFAMRLRFESYLEQQIHILLVVDVFICAATCSLEVLYDNRLVKFCRTYLCLIQGTWLIHAGFIIQGDGTGSARTYPESLEWVSILFSWHLAGNFILFVGLLLTTRSASKTDLFENYCCSFSLKMDSSLDTTQRTSPTLVSSSSKASKFFTRSDSTLQPHSLPTISRRTPDQLPRSNYTFRVAESQVPVIIEAIPKDNIEILDESSDEQYNTLSREAELRASIKLKESSLI